MRPSAVLFLACLPLAVAGVFLPGLAAVALLAVAAGMICKWRGA